MTAVSLALGCAVTLAAAKDPLADDPARAAQAPSWPPLKDFASIWTKPTFRPTTSTTESAAPSSRSVGGWSLLALVKIGAEPFAILQNEKTGRRMYVDPKPSPDGFSVESAHFDPDPEKETVSIQHNQETTIYHYSPPILNELKKRYQAIKESDMIPGSP